MFLQALEKQNPALIDAAYLLWQQGKIVPDSYVIDVDQLLENARLLVAQAQRFGIKLYIMGKQFGRNPLLYRRLLEAGCDGIVAVDYKEVRQLYRHSLPVAHLGHLVQPPTAMLPEIIRQQPQVITVYSLEKIVQIATEAVKQQRTQSLLLKVYQIGDLLYSGQESGFHLDELPGLLAKITPLSGVRVVGVTHFPCLLFDTERQRTQPTVNLATLVSAKAILQQQGITVEQLNAPSASSYSTLPLLAQHGVTHAEPGHAFTGTLPANQQGTEPEKVAILYLSEISHHFNQNSYCFGGGYYRRGNLKQALIIDQEQRHYADILPLEASSIDYCLGLAGEAKVGSAVIMSFRTQIFVTRSDVVLVQGIQSQQPRVLGIYNSQGDRLAGEEHQDGDSH